jgi:hypothetical protein
MLIGPNGGISQYEGITWIRSTGNFLLARENALDIGVKEFYTEILEVNVAADHSNYTIIEECVLDFKFDSDNKGIESVRHFEWNDSLYMLALCEGNNCLSGKSGNQPGNGRILLTQHVNATDTTPCSWKVIKMINIPPEAAFIDYAGIGYWRPNDADSKFMFGVLSQESSALWVGEFDLDLWEFTTGVGHVYHFPRDDACFVQHCNVEGFQFLDKGMIVVTSDRMKGHGKQSFHCFDNDQSILYFNLPEHGDN